VSVALLLVAITLPSTPALGAPKDPPRAPNRYRFVADPGGSLLVHGTYPPISSSCVGAEQPVLHERYRGAVEVVRASDGDLYLIGELGFEDYMKGIAEVPRDWPMEALKAQVVAARTYAAAHLDPGGSYDLCATDACQVYVGMAIEAGPWGHRWIRAVEDTEGEILRYGGRPANTFYFSTSNGRTYGNDVVFGGSPLPYLQGGPETDDGASPLARWTATFPLGDLSRFLAADGRWSGRPIRSVRQDDGRIVIEGSRARSKVVLNREALRDALNDWASCLEPSEYPAREGGGYRLPQPVPSMWFTAHQDDDVLVVEGRGWGHGVGMVQWGAYGKAKRGLSYDQILAAYYGGLRPKRVDLPQTIRVLLATDLTSVTVVPSGEATVGGGRDAPQPPWRLTGGRKLRIHHGPSPPAVLRANGFSADPRATPGDRLATRVRLSATARVRLRFMGEGTATDTPWQPFHEGVASPAVSVPDVPPGRYRVRAIAWDGVDIVRSSPVTVRIRPAGPSPSPVPSPSGPISPVAAPPSSGDPPAFPVAAVLLGAGALLAVVVLTLRRRRRLHPS
jgi:stage II sporulation protein D